MLSLITLSIICLEMIKGLNHETWKKSGNYVKSFRVERKFGWWRMAKLEGFFNKSCENSWKTLILWFQKWTVLRGKEKNVDEDTAFVSSNDIACSWFLISQNQILAPWFSIAETEFRSLPRILQGILFHKSHFKFLITRLHNLLDNLSEVKK